MTSLVHQTEKHSKSWNCWGNRTFTNFSKIAFSENWLQILKIVRGFKLTPEIRLFRTWSTRLYTTEQVRSILQPEISTHFAHFRFEIWITRYPWERKYSRKCFEAHQFMVQMHQKYRWNQIRKKSTKWNKSECTKSTIISIYYIPQPQETSYILGDEESIMCIYVLVFNSRKLFKPAKLINLW